MTSNSYRIRQFFLLLLFFKFVAHAQSTGNTSGQDSPSEPEGWKNRGYVIHQSTEIGYRSIDVTDSGQMYNTLVDLQTGPRLLDQTLSMQSETHEGLLFDNLFVSSFGWGGDPNNALRARIDKSTWYDFRASFRRDQSDWDFNLLTNPLNPPTSSPSVPANSSPHSFYTRRRMSDVDLTLLPQSRISLRLGYSHNNMTGPSYSSVHEGTDALLYQAWNTTQNSYRFGADLKLWPRTVVSYDQFLDYYKGDTTWQLAPFVPALLPGSSGSVELGLPIDTANKTPCAINSPATSLIDSTGHLTNLACNAYFNYSRSDRARTSTPTERISVRTTDFSRLELTASYAYSSATMNAPLNELFDGLISRSSIRQETVAGPAEAKRSSNVVDFSIIAHLSSHIRLIDTFRRWTYRIPESFISTETDWICNPSVTCNLLTPLSETTPTPTNTSDQKSFNQSWLRNQLDLVWDASKQYGGRIGFRYGDKDFLHINDFVTGDEDHIVIHEFTPLFAFWARPMTSLRLNFDWEHTNNDATIVRVGPRKESRTRFQVNYTPRPWAILTGMLNLSQVSNADALVDYRGHNRNYGFTASLTPRERLGIDLAYNYNNYQQNAFICFSDSDTTLPVVASAGSCTTNGYNDSKNNLLTYGTYTNGTHYGMGAVLFRPAPRVTTQVGYSITSVDGQTPQFNSLQPPGSLEYRYQQPLANLAVDIGHNITAKGGWNYYQYGESSFVGPTLPRYFHANNATFSLCWAF